ncbi:MAG TPA: GNAT family N-acetyltransferase, partial [Steroidobacteraceae bacterium]|nr:GNAT family N-acetyltransferase [Steroidobacteraceae bacterium]
MANIYHLKQRHVADAATRRYTISVDFDVSAVDPQWRELETSGGLSPFQSRMWLLPWYRIIAPALGISPLFVTVRDENSGRPMMLLPLCTRREHGVTTIRFADCHVCDYNAPLLSAQFYPSAAEFAALWAEIVRAMPRADIIYLEKILEKVGGRSNPMSRLAESKRMNMRAWGFDLPRTRNAYEKLITSAARKRFRQERRYLEREGRVQYVRATTEAQGRELFDVLRRQRCARWGHGENLSKQAFLRFYETAIFGNWNKRFCVLSGLKVGDEFAASMLSLNLDDRFYVLKHSFEIDRWGKKSPGTVIIDSAVTDQIAHGTKYFDLTIGNDLYKRRFGCKENYLYLLVQGL